MYIKRGTLIFLVLIICVFASCGGSGEDAGASAPAEQSDAQSDYQSMLQAYNEKSLDVNVTFTVECATPVENRFSLSYDEGYTVTDLDSGKSLTYGADASEEEVYGVAGYLPPYESAYPDGEGVYSAELAGDIILEKLLSGSNLFSGYGLENVSLDGGCDYVAYADGQILSYSYEFAVNIDDGGAQFPAKIKYFIEVNK